jgi:F0F1-type ATP synthase membrane subunit c/vacuolar-type H+-ATPase subunit K
MFEDELDEIDYLVGMIHSGSSSLSASIGDGILIVAEHSVQFRQPDHG